ncbi:MerR family transcriptional regulator [Paenibacillus nasutitermitis]|uniref:MerR family transcriptional regulator n=1 Tax=Paenibacillus nasutitermitis TaxID=1652958 RepID=A0A917DXQ7_9BACL|nr:MerR family transcriptional regulator [Paenibacillus nasutitermitis]GGD81500.1 MerR family transcriptional regulator [Paenibacillus nasutitermitis]
MYSIKKVSEMLGIPTVTLRAWENRYHIISPNRSEGGHRMFSDNDIKKLRFLKLQMEKHGLKISEAVHLLQQKESKTSFKTKKDTQSGKTYENLIDELYQPLIDYNTLRANEIIDMAFSLYEFEDVFHQILIPVLQRIGTEWEAGELTVAQEHFTSQLIMHRFFQFFRILPVHPYFPKVLAFCPGGEHHHMGLMLFSLFLKKKGFDVIYLGPDTPFEGLSDVIRMKNISIIAISATDPVNIGMLAPWMEASTKEYPNLKFVLGGQAFGQAADPLPLDLVNIYYADQTDWEQWYLEQDLFVKR